MKYLRLLIGMASSSILLSCGSKNSPNAGDSTKLYVDTTTKVVLDTVNSKALVSIDLKFIAEEETMGLQESTLGKLAFKKMTSPAIKNFEIINATDYMNSERELTAIAKKKGIPLVASMDTIQQQKVDSLTKLKGKLFTKAYIYLLINAYNKKLSLMNMEIQNGKDDDLKSFAQKSINVVRSQLNAINKINTQGGYIRVNDGHTNN